jgi:hypothetical protein
MTKIYSGQIFAPNGTNLLTAVNGGGLGDSVAGVALHSDAATASTWETFKLILQSGSLGSGMEFALQTSGGQYVTAINGGGVGGPNDKTCPFHTDATYGNAWEGFNLVVDDSVNPPTVTIQTETNTYVTAVNGGGVNGGNSQPIHTDAIPIGADEKFLFLGNALNDQTQISIQLKPNCNGPFNGNVAGSTTLTINQNGNWNFSGTFNNSNYVPCTVLYGIGIKVGNVVLGFSWSGSVDAGLPWDNNNVNFNLSGNNSQITANWDNLMKGWTFRWNEQCNVNWGAIGQAILNGLQQAGQAALQVIEVVGSAFASAPSC